MRLDDLRTRIAAIDEDLVRLMGERISIAREIGAQKRSEGLPIRDRGVEDKVVTRFRDAAASNGFPLAAAEDIARILIQEAIEEQAALPRPHKERQDIMIIGGAGKMGAWLDRLMRSSGHRTFINDPGLEDGAPLDMAASMDHVIIATPISSVEGILMELDDICPEDVNIFDVSSLKSPFLDTLKALSTRRSVCSVHPMFGPGARSMYDRNLLICDCGNPSSVQETCDLFQDHGAIMTIIPVDEHDRYMSYVLGMSHAVNIAFFTALERSGIDMGDFDRVASTTFTKHLDSARSVASEDARLYYEIQHLNRRSFDIWGEFSDAVGLVREASLDDDPAAFRELMEKGKRYFQG